MPNNFRDLRSLLEATTQSHRDALGEIIESPIGNSPSLLCDHLCFLRAGGIGQLFDQRDYKQLVTDVADRVQINWNSLGGEATRATLSAQQIEAAIVHQVDSSRQAGKHDEVQPHIPEPVAFMLKEILIERIIRRAPLLSSSGQILDDIFENVLSLLSTDWRKLVAAVVFVHRIIRPCSSGRR